MSHYTTGRRWRQRRNIVIAAAADRKVPQRVLADVFDLSQSRISQIVSAVRAKTDRAGTARRGIGKGTSPPFLFAGSDRRRLVC